MFSLETSLPSQKNQASWDDQTVGWGRFCKRDHTLKIFSLALKRWETLDWGCLSSWFSTVWNIKQGIANLNGLLKSPLQLQKFWGLATNADPFEEMYLLWLTNRIMLNCPFKHNHTVLHCSWIYISNYAW